MPDELSEARARAGSAIRDIGHAFIGRHASLDQIERLADQLEALSAEFWPAEERVRTPTADDTERRQHPQGAFETNFDDRPISGRSSPWGLDAEFHRHGDEIEALVTLRAAHEGAPGRCHGGIVAALFDDVFGYVLDVISQPAFTGELTVRYPGTHAAPPSARVPSPFRRTSGPQDPDQRHADRHRVGHGGGDVALDLHRRRPVGVRTPDRRTTGTPRRRRMIRSR